MLAASFGIALVVAAVAVAVGIGVQNRGFEQGLDHWTAKTLDSNRDVVYGPGGGLGEEVPGCEAPDAYGICVVDGPDEFEVSDGGGARTVTVSPLEGDKMLRLAGPFHDSSERQAEEHIFQVSQEFIVDPGEPVVTLNYDLFTFDYLGYDQLRLRVRVFDEEGSLVNNTVQGGFGSGTDLKTTGWRGVNMDLSPYAGQEMVIQLQVQGTTDSLFGTWGYFDAGTAPVPPVDPEGASGEAPPGVTVNKQVGENGLLAFALSSFEVMNAALGEIEECMPFTVTLPINGGSSELSNVTLNYRGQKVSMTPAGGNLWEAEFCIGTPFTGTSQLELAYDATEGGVTQHFIVVVGQIVLIDPQGIVYDLEKFEHAKSLGKSDEQARADAAIQGASVLLQRETPQGSDAFVNVLSADPGIAPNVNPQTTASDGRYQWDVSEGTYRVVVSKTGYYPMISDAVKIPPPVFDLHIPLEAIPGIPSDDDSGSSDEDSSSGAGSSAAPPPPPAPPSLNPQQVCVGQANVAYRKKVRRVSRLMRARGRGAAKKRKRAVRLKRAAAKQRRVALKRCRGEAVNTGAARCRAKANAAYRGKVRRANRLKRSKGGGAAHRVRRAAAKQRRVALKRCRSGRGKGAGRGSR